MPQIVFVDMRKLRQLLQRNILTAVCVDIAPDRFTQVRGSFIGWRQDGLKVCLSAKQHDQDFHQILTDCLIAGRTGFNFPEHHFQVKVHRFFDLPKADDTEIFPFICDGQLQVFNPQDDIFKRICMKAKLCMGNVWIDNDEIVCG